MDTKNSKVSDLPPDTAPDLDYVGMDDAATEEAASDDPRRMVKIRLQMDKKKGKGLYVNVNDHRYFIPRGETVEVPYYIKAVLNNSAKQDEETAKLIDELGGNADF